MSVTALLLAAGASSRMGTPKALLEVDHSTFLDRIARTARAAGASSIVVVLGPPDGDAIKARIPPGAAWTWNHDPSRGMVTSVQAGLLTLPSRTLSILVWPVDVPFVAEATVRRLLAVAPGSLVVPRHGGRGGHPIRIPQRLFPQLAALAPEAGLRALLEQNPDVVMPLEVDDAAVCEDIDTPADFARAKSEAGEPSDAPPPPILHRRAPPPASPMIERLTSRTTPARQPEGKAAGGARPPKSEKAGRGDKAES